MICYRCGKEVAGEAMHGLHTACFKGWFDAGSDDDFQSLALHTEATNTPRDIANSFYHGKFKKYSARLLQREYILKTSTEYPELVRTEYLCNQLASALGLEVSKYFLIRFQNLEDCFVTYNFMQDHEAADLKHIYHFVQSGEEFSVKTLIKIIEDETGRRSEVSKFINICLFDALTGNHDRHGRNLGIIITSARRFLAPSYDNPSYLGIEEDAFLGAHHEPRGRIATAGQLEPVIKDYAQEFIQMGYISSVKEFLDHVDLLKLDRLIEGSFISERRKVALKALINRRYQELKNVL